MELFKQESLKKRTEIYFLHLIKDPRAQIISFINNRIRKNKPKNMANIFLLFRRWDINHRRLELFLKSNNFRYKKVNYEELCLDHKKTIEDIYAFLNANQPLQNIKNFNKNQNHLYAGNRIRLSNLDTLEIKYDYSWFNRHEWLLPYLLFIMIKRKKNNGVLNYYQSDKVSCD